MKVFIADLQRSIQKKGYWYFIIIILLLISSFLFAVAMATIKQQEYQKREYEQIYTDCQYYSLFDSLVNELEDEIYKNPITIKQLKLFNELLKKEESFTYLELYNNAVYIKEYEGPLENLNQYETGNYEQNHKVEIHGVGNGCYSAVKGMWIGNNVAEHFALTLSDGTFPEEQDFLWDDTHTVKVVLGNGYRSDFQIGDTFCIDFFVGNRQAEVIGFLEEGETILYKNRLVNLDNYLLLPQYEMDLPSTGVDSKEYHAFWFTYLMKNSGMISTHISAEQVQEIICSLCENVGLPLIYYIDEAENRQLLTFGNNINELLEISLVLSIGSILLSIVLLCVHFSLRIKDNTKYYAILCCCGYSRKKIFAMVTAELVLLIFVSVTIGYMMAIFLAALLMIERAGSPFLLFLIYGVIPLLHAWYRLNHFEIMKGLQEE